MSWDPLYLHHAVERVRFEILFAEQLPRKLVDKLSAAFDAKRSDLRFDPPQEMQVHDFVMGQGSVVPAPLSVAAWQAVRKSSTAVAQEAIIVDSRRLVYESTDYRGWTKAFSRYGSVCSDTLGEIGQLVSASTIIHDYVDRFVYQGAAEKAAPAGIIRKELLPMMPSSVLDGTELWHCHRGWFEDIEGEKFLINQNFDAQEGTTANGQTARSIQIYTKVERRAGTPGLDFSELDGIFQVMHTRCNRLVADALTADGASRVGLSDGSDKNG